MQTAIVPTAVAAEKKSTIDRLRPLRVSPWVRAGFRVTSTLAPGAAVQLAHKLFFTPPRAPVRDEERAVLQRGESFALEVGGQRVAGRVWGAGPTLLLVHGWGGHSGQMTPLVGPAVTAGLRVVAIDLPGHGESAGRLSSLVHFTAALQRAAALFSPLRGLAAHSFGAAASTYAMSSGVTVGRAVFFAPPARFASFWARFQAAAGLSDEIFQRVVREAEGWLNVRFEGIAPIDLAPRMTAPLLIFHDPEDREMLFEEGAELASRWPGAMLRRAEGVGHLRILRDESCVAQAVTFLAS